MSKKATELLGVKRSVSRTLRGKLGLKGEGWTIQNVNLYGVVVCQLGNDFKSFPLNEIRGEL